MTVHRRVHRKATRNLLDSLFMSRSRLQQGLYCIGCEEYKDEKELMTEDGEEDGIKCLCPIHRTKCESRKERNYFFRLSKYQKEIEQLLEGSIEEGGGAGLSIMPISRRNEVLGWVHEGLRDFSISRAAVEWGIPIARDPEQTVYVWFDALLGYVSALLKIDDEVGGSSLPERCSNAGWPASVHIIGKDILRFHAVYWPAMLLSAGLDVPQCVFGHGFLTKDGLKMGKSLGNVLHPDELVNTFGADPVRYYFLAEMEFGKDGDFSENRFIEKVNASLANDVGNLLNRTLKMFRKNCEGVIDYDISLSFDADHPIRAICTSAVGDAKEAYESMRFHEACSAALSISGACNRFLEQKEPWIKLKNGTDEEKLEAKKDLIAVLEATRIVAYILWPIVPSLSVKILEQLRVLQKLQNDTDQIIPKWEYAVWGGGGLQVGHEVVSKPSPVFMRLEGTVQAAV